MRYRKRKTRQLLGKRREALPTTVPPVIQKEEEETSSNTTHLLLLELPVEVVAHILEYAGGRKFEAVLILRLVCTLFRDLVDALLLQHVEPVPTQTYQCDNRLGFGNPHVDQKLIFKSLPLSACFNPEDGLSQALLFPDLSRLSEVSIHDCFLPNLDFLSGVKTVQLYDCVINGSLAPLAAAESVKITNFGGNIGFDVSPLHAVHTVVLKGACFRGVENLQQVQDLTLYQCTGEINLFHLAHSPSLSVISCPDAFGFPEDATAKKVTIGNLGFNVDFSKKPFSHIQSLTLMNCDLPIPRYVELLRDIPELSIHNVLSVHMNEKAEDRTCRKLHIEVLHLLHIRSWEKRATVLLGGLATNMADMLEVAPLCQISTVLNTFFSKRYRSYFEADQLITSFLSCTSHKIPDYVTVRQRFQETVLCSVHDDDGEWTQKSVRQIHFTKPMTVLHSVIFAAIDSSSSIDIPDLKTLAKEMPKFSELNTFQINSYPTLAWCWSKDDIYHAVYVFTSWDTCPNEPSVHHVTDHPLIW